LVMGVEHGLYCLGCCWLAMALLFVFGVMNLLWIATLAVLVLAEKVVPGGPWIARASGVAMIAAGAYRLAS
jgi:predicted metal-binding membrane protein